MLTFSVNTKSWEIQDKILQEKATTMNRNRWMLSVIAECDKPVYYNKTLHRYVSREEEISDRIFAGFLTRGLVDSSEINHPSWAKKHNIDSNKFNYSQLSVNHPDDADVIDAFLYNSEKTSNPCYIEPELTEEKLVYEEQLAFFKEKLEEYTKWKMLRDGVIGYNAIRRMINLNKMGEVGRELKLFFDYLKDAEGLSDSDLLEGFTCIQYVLQQLILDWGIASNAIYEEKMASGLNEYDVMVEEELRMRELERLKGEVFLDWGILDYKQAGMEPPEELMQTIRDFQALQRKERDRLRCKRA